MKLMVPAVNGRAGKASAYGHKHSVIDLHTGKTVGYLYSRRGFNLGDQRIRSWAISLFNNQFEGKYERWEECVAFAEGVEQVLAIFERALSMEKTEGAEHSGTSAA
jgi:hypothetical protein